MIPSVVAGAILLATTTVAYAHATLVSSEPSANAVLSASPPRVRLVFSEQVEPTLARVSLVAADGGATPLAVAGDPRDVDALIAPVSGLHAGSYRLVWRIVSVDGHPVDGSFVFSIGAASDHAPPDTGVVSAPATWGPSLLGAPILAAALRGAAVCALAAFGGLLFFLFWSRAGSEAEQRGPMRVANMLAISAPVLVLLHMVAWIVNVSPDHGLTRDGIESALASGIGRTELWRLGLTAAGSLFLWLSRRPGLALLFASAALVVSGATGHSAAIGAPWAAPAKALHLAGSAAWLGGLAWLLSLDRTDRVRFTRETSRVSSVALTSVVAVALSGVLQAVLFTPSLRELAASPYGAVLGAKILGLLVLVAFGARHRFRMMPKVHGDAASLDGFRNSIAREVLVMAVVFLVGGLLAYVPVPAEPTLTPTTHAQGQ